MYTYILFVLLVRQWTESTDYIFLPFRLLPESQEVSW
jgi:hypothetical protein